MKTVMSSNGQIILPAEFRQQDRIKPGQEFELFLSCPSKGWFQPADRTETTENH